MATSKDDADKKAAGPPPHISQLLDNAIQEIILINSGYTKSVPIEGMTYFQMGVRNIAANMYQNIHPRLM